MTKEQQQHLAHIVKSGEMEEILRMISRLADLYVRGFETYGISVSLALKWPPANGDGDRIATILYPEKNTLSIEDKTLPPMRWN